MADSRPRPHPRRCGHGRPSTSRRARPRSRRRNARAGAGHPRSFRSRGWCSRNRGKNAARPVPEDALAGPRRDVGRALGCARRWRNHCRRRYRRHRDPYTWARAGSSLLLASGKPDSFRGRPGSSREHGVDSDESRRRPVRLHGVPRAHSGARARQDSSRSWTGHRGAAIATEGLYRASTREREQQVLEALRAGDSDPDAIVERIYRSIKERLLPLAREGVIAQLIKLEREGRARRDGDAWHIIDP